MRITNVGIRLEVSGSLLSHSNRLPTFYGRVAKLIFLLMTIPCQIYAEDKTPTVGELIAKFSASPSDAANNKLIVKFGDRTSGQLVQLLVNDNVKVRGMAEQLLLEIKDPAIIPLEHSIRFEPKIRDRAIGILVKMGDRIVPQMLSWLPHDNQGNYEIASIEYDSVFRILSAIGPTVVAKLQIIVKDESAYQRNDAAFSLGMLSSTASDFQTLTDCLHNAKDKEITRRAVFGVAKSSVRTTEKTSFLKAYLGSADPMVSLYAQIGIGVSSRTERR